MSKQKRGMFRRMMTAVAMAIGFPITHHYADPVFKDQRGIPQRRKKRAHGHVSKGRWSPTKVTVRRALPCEPGTIRYHDKLVAHFGRRRADGYHECIQRKMMSALPSEQEFADNPPWAFLK